MICLFGNYFVPLIFVYVHDIAHAHEYLPVKFESKFLPCEISLSYFSALTI
jgi:hypothetical protein